MKETTPYHVSLNFLLSGHDLPPAPVEELVKSDPFNAVGVILFDAWICNADRHRGNIAFDTSTKKVNIFDHSHALFRGVDGKKFMEDRKDRLAIENHCLAPHVTQTQHFQEWSDRINSVPEYYIRESLGHGEGIGFTKDDIDFGLNYLLSRRERLMGMVDKQKGKFPKAIWA